VLNSQRPHAKAYQKVPTNSKLYRRANQYLQINTSATQKQRLRGLFRFLEHTIIWNSNLYKCLLEFTGYHLYKKQSGFECYYRNIELKRLHNS